MALFPQFSLPHDPLTLTVFVCCAAGGLLLLSCLSSRLTRQLGIPLSLMFLIIGMLAGSDGPGGIAFDSFTIAYFFGTLALVLILFAGGLNTSWARVKSVAAPAGVLATVGVLGVAGLTALMAHVLGLSWPEAMLIGAIVSSTDAAAVFEMLHDTPLQERVAATVELESGLNDPAAVILTTVMAAYMVGGTEIGWNVPREILWQLAVGLGCGLLTGFLGQWLYRQPRFITTPLRPVFLVGVALMAYGLPAGLEASGFLSVFVAGMVVGNHELPEHKEMLSIHGAIAWQAQALMFLMLGLLVFPSQLPPVALLGMALAVFLALVARPVAVTLCLLPFRYAPREIAAVSWLGLRGAMPIILATIPVLCAPGKSVAMQDALSAFDIVFFIVVVGSIIPGTLARRVVHKLGLLQPHRAPHH